MIEAASLAAGGGRRRRSIDPRLLAVAAATALVTLVVRWLLAPQLDTSTFDPVPDGQEYAASAQSIAQDGRYLLHFGPVAYRSRYPPGYPMLLAVALRLGVPPTRLVDATALADAGLTFLVALLAGLGVSATRRALEPDRDAASGTLAACLAAAVAGTVASFSWWHVLRSTKLNSDSACVLAGAIALLAWAKLFVGAPGRRARVALAVAAGAAFSATCAIRPIEAVLLAPALALAPIALRAGRLAALRAALPGFAVGAAAPSALVAGLLVRSGRPATEWSAYEFWVPWITQPGVALHPRYFLEAAELPGIFTTDHGWPGWRALLSAVFGVPSGYDVGFLWPAAAWIAAVWLVVRLRRASSGRALLASIGLLGLWSATHCAFYPFYFFPAQRFYLVPAHVATLFAGAAVGLAFAHRRRAVRAVALVVGLLMTVSAVRGWRELARFHKHKPQGVVQAQLEVQFERWSRMGPEARRRHGVGFDLLRAQALGWLDEETVARVRVWGPLPLGPHVRRLAETGLLRPELLPRELRRSSAVDHAWRRAHGEDRLFFHDGFERGDAGRWSVSEPP